MRRLVVLVNCVALAICSTPTAAGQSRPEALENLQRQRAALETASIEFSWQYHRFFAWPRFCTGRFAGPDEIVIDRGDAEGLMRAPDGSVNPAMRCPRLTLKLEEETWVYESNGVFARCEEECRLAEHIHRMRALGAAPQYSYSDIDETLWGEPENQPVARKYREQVHEGLHVVSCEADYGTTTATTTWWIDPRRGWSPVRVTLEQDGKVLCESRSTLKQFRGVWYPETVLFFQCKYKDGKEPVETVKVHGAYFNRPEHPKRFTPADIGVEAGMMVEKENADQTTALLVFDGKQALTQAEFREREDAGEIELGPTFLRASARARAKRALREAVQKVGGRKADDADQSTVQAALQRLIESEWEAYTRRFIARFKLNEEQSQKAWLILSQCQQLADGRVQRHRTEFEELDHEFQAAREAKDKEQLAALEQRRAKLMGPVTRIFEGVLKPRLDALPTRTQRQAAEPDSEQPTDKP